MASWFAQPPADPLKQVVTPILVVAAHLLVLFGILFLVPGLLDLLAAIGVLWRRRWGRILTFVMGALAFGFGLLWLSGGQDGTADATDLAAEVGQILYGIVAILILAVKGGEFAAQLPQAS